MLIALVPMIAATLVRNRELLHGMHACSVSQDWDAERFWSSAMLACSQVIIWEGRRRCIGLMLSNAAKTLSYAVPPSAHQVATIVVQLLDIIMHHVL